MKKREKSLEKELTSRDIRRATEFLRLHDQRKRMIDYLNMKVSLEDWHGVADAAMDLREIDAKLYILNTEMK